MTATAHREPTAGGTGPRLRVPFLDPIRKYFPGDALGGVVLIACAAVAMFLANSAWSGAFFGLLHTKVPVTLGAIELELSVLHWINDLLMAVFFLVVGMEIKREFMAGELSDPRRAALPAAGALGGMVVPALIYAAFNAGTVAGHGWGIPMATDIAFSLGVLALLGDRVPRGITVFLAALAIVDDLGAVSVIAVFYTSTLDLQALLIALGLVTLLALLSGFGVRKLSIYLAVAPFLWFFMFKSGVHATVAGVLLGWTIPLGRLDHGDMLASPLLLLEHALKPWVSWVIMPVFALANAGVSLAGMSPGSLGSPVTAGVGLGLLFGKPIGIFLVSLLAVKIGVARLPRGANWSTMWGVGMIAGIGFTMALFVASLSFRGDTHLEDLAKVGILVASLLSGILGSIVLGRAVKHLPPPPEEQPVRANFDPNLPRVVRSGDAGAES